MLNYYVEGSENVATWAQTYIGSLSVTKKHQVLRTSESLFRKVFAVKSAKDILMLRTLAQLLFATRLPRI